LQALGISAVRAKLPLTTSINLYSIVAAASLAAVIVLWRQARRPAHRRALLLCGAASVYCLLLGDSRGAMAIAVITAILFAFRVAVRARGWMIGALVPLPPILFLGVLKIIASPSLENGLSRGGSGFQSATTGTGRLYIWDGAWQVLRGLPAGEVFGWGAGGHITSNASLNYAFVFGGNSDAVQVFTHNIVLQTLFDTGIVGLVLLATAVGATWSLLRRHVLVDTFSPALALMAILLVVVLQGMTEVSPSYYAQEALLAVLLIMGAAVGLQRRRELAPYQTDPGSPGSSRSGVAPTQSASR
jgi:O-antigen ligase